MTSEVLHVIMMGNLLLLFIIQVFSLHLFSVSISSIPHLNSSYLSIYGKIN